MDASYRKLYRSQSDRMIGGVCGGLGHHFAIDPTLIRILFVGAALIGGHGVLLYILLLILVPIEPSPAPVPQAS
jgi:phage shock protein PspC (stress-responsive transcriptional regulator)